MLIEVSFALSIFSSSFSIEVMTKNFSKIVTDHYEILKLNVDINTINRIISNMGEMINLKLLDKKFINMFLISVKVEFCIYRQILNEKNKIN